VPILPPPNVHTLLLPIDLRMLVDTSQGMKHGNVKKAISACGQPGCLKKMRGIKSLALELSWMSVIIHVL
jgi:hypothetical protein